MIIVEAFLSQIVKLHRMPKLFVLFHFGEL